MSELFPYDLIGKFVVLAILTLFTLLTVIALAVILYIVWLRGLTWISDRMWKGYDPAEGEYPPTLKLRISGVTICIRDFRIRKIPEVWNEAAEMGEESKNEDVQ